MMAPLDQQLNAGFDDDASTSINNLNVSDSMMVRFGCHLTVQDMNDPAAFTQVFSPTQVGTPVQGYSDASFANPSIALPNVSQAADLFLNQGRSATFQVGPVGATALLKALHELRGAGLGGFTDLPAYINAQCAHGNMLALLGCFIDANLTGRPVQSDRLDYPSVVPNSDPHSGVIGLVEQMKAIATISNPVMFGVAGPGQPPQAARAANAVQGTFSVQQMAMMSQLQPRLAPAEGGQGLSAACCFEAFRASAENFDHYKALHQMMDILLKFSAVFQPPRDSPYTKGDCELSRFISALRQRNIVDAKKEPMTILTLAQQHLPTLRPSLLAIQSVVNRDLQSLKRHRMFQKQFDGEDDGDDDSHVPKYMKKLLDVMARKPDSGGANGKGKTPPAKSDRAPSKTRSLINDLRTALMLRLPKSGTMSDKEHHQAAYKALLAAVGSRCVGCNQTLTGPNRSCAVIACKGTSVHATIAQQVAAISKL
jgi:hypothetical protein